MSPLLFFLILGTALVAIELVLMSMTVFWFLFFGVGALITALAAWAVPDMSWSVALTIFLVSSVLITLVLYAPLSRWQKQPSPIAGHDAIGQRVDVLTAIEEGGEGEVSWSGSKWKARLVQGESAIAAGESAEITKLEGIRLFVKKL